MSTEMWFIILWHAEMGGARGRAYIAHVSRKTVSNFRSHYILGSSLFDCAWENIGSPVPCTIEARVLLCTIKARNVKR